VYLTGKVRGRGVQALMLKLSYEMKIIKYLELCHCTYLKSCSGRTLKCEKGKGSKGKVSKV
jgi:hypothetical protein